MARAIRCLVYGRVQGVFYRATTVERAVELGLCGWVRNRDDGSVEVVASGSEEALAGLSRWLWEGPARAVVEAVQIEEWLGDTGESFEVRR